MKKVNIINNKTGQKYSATLENPNSWISENIKLNSWGKSERWVKKKILISENNFSYPQEIYEDLDVIEEKSEQSLTEYTINENNEQIFKVIDYVKLKAEYTITILDISISHAKKQKEIEILTAYENKMNLISSKYPPSEREGWAVKKNQAEIWLSSTDLEKQELKLKLLMLVSESLSNSNEDITALANSIIRDSNAYQVFYGTETKNKRSKLKLLESANTLEEINLIKY